MFFDMRVKNYFKLQLNDQTAFHHSKSRLVRYSDLHCNMFVNIFQCIDKIKIRNIAPKTFKAHTQQTLSSFFFLFQIIIDFLIIENK